MKTTWARCEVRPRITPTPVHPRNLHVEEHELGLEALDGSDRLLPIRSLSHDLDVGLLLEQREDALTRHRLVVSTDQGADSVHEDLQPGSRAAARAAPSRGHSR